MRALISTIRPGVGGVSTKLAWLMRELELLGITPVLAWYEPWSCSPEQSLPLAASLPALLRGAHPLQRSLVLDGGWSGEGIGAWLPELEFTHYLPDQAWRALADSCQLHLAVTGNPLCAARLSLLQRPYLAWVGSDFAGDRRDRVARFPAHRRLLDQVVNAPLLRRLERRALQDPAGRILSISGATARSLERIAGKPLAGVLYRPCNPQLFRCEPERCVPWRIGFSGRYSDPRKQIGLLLKAVARLAAQNRPVQLELTGEADGRLLQPQLERLGIADRVRLHPLLAKRDLARVMQSWDVFVIPSHQEGLCLAALEAMACGVPLLSTPCGGPEELLDGGRCGELVPPQPEALATAVARCCGDRERRQRLSAGALAWVQANADPGTARRRLHQALAQTFAALRPWLL
ncbi:MAG: glycosyltransferase family 4 protein [Cyanobacteriota bacterium]|nr:glycosyltransferase family 4 protein [Cyanobacteriota bacterium]